MWHGISCIDGKYPDRSATMDGLAYVTGLCASIGFDTLKLELSTGYAIKYAQNNWSSPGTLEQLLADTPMANVLGNAAFNRFMFNAFSLVNTQDNQWAYAWTDAIGDALEVEFYDACAHLRATYPNKDFILQNWEGDWQLLNAFDATRGIPLTRLNAYRDWHRRRYRALHKANADNPGGTGSIRYGIECNRSLDFYGTRLVRDVLTNVPHDLAMESCYNCIEGWTTITNQAALEADIDTKLRALFARMRTVTQAPIVLSEYGFPRLAPYFPSGLDVAALHARVIATATALGIEGEIPWQATDNEELSPGNPRGFGFWDRNGNATTVGAITSVGVYYRDHVL